MRINWLAILVALIVQQVLGFTWYSRALFAEAWMAGIGKRPEDLVPSPGPFIVATIAAILLPIGIAWILHRTNLRGIKNGALVGLGVGVLLVAPPVLVHEAFLGYPPTVLAIDAGKEIVGCFIVGVILGAWPRRDATHV
jgi:Protein of unknown function (DUF1761)